MDTPRPLSPETLTERESLPLGARLAFVRTAYGRVWDLLTGVNTRVVDPKDVSNYLRTTDA